MWLQDPSHATFKEKMKEFMANFDKNSDGRIEMSEVSPGYSYMFFFIMSCLVCSLYRFPMNLTNKV